MVKKTLTREGVKIEDIDIPKEETKVEEVKEKKEKKVSDYSYTTNKTKKIYMILGTSILSIFLIILMINMFWFNNSVSDGKFKSNDSITNIVNPPQVNISMNVTNNNYNNFTIPVYITISNDTLGNLSNQIVNSIMNKTKNCMQLNWTNCSI